MTHKWGFSIQDTPEGEPKQLAAEFSDDEWKALSGFDEYAYKLLKIKLLREGSPAKLECHWKQGEGLTFSWQLPPDEQICELLHRLRPFVLNDEPTNFNKICNYITHRVENQSLRQFIKIEKAIYTGKCMPGLIVVSKGVMVNLDDILKKGVVINSDEILNKWLNAYEYHQDPDKQAEIEGLHRLIPLEASRAIFVMMLIGKVKAIGNVQALVRTILGKHQNFRISPF